MQKYTSYIPCLVFRWGSRCSLPPFTRTSRKYIAQKAVEHYSNRWLFSLAAKFLNFESKTLICKTTHKKANFLGKKYHIKALSSLWGQYSYTKFKKRNSPAVWMKELNYHRHEVYGHGYANGGDELVAALNQLKSFNDSSHCGRAGLWRQQSLGGVVQDKYSCASIVQQGRGSVHTQLRQGSHRSTAV